MATSLIQNSGATLLRSGDTYEITASGSNRAAFYPGFRKASASGHTLSSWTHNAENITQNSIGPELTVSTVYLTRMVGSILEASLPTGNTAITATWSAFADTQWAGSVLVFDGVNQTTPYVAGTQSSFASAVPTAVTYDANIGDSVVYVYADNTNTAPAVPSGFTQINSDTNSGDPQIDEAAIFVEANITENRSGASVVSNNGSATGFHYVFVVKSADVAGSLDTASSPTALGGTINFTTSGMGSITSRTIISQFVSLSLSGTDTTAVVPALGNDILQIPLGANTFQVSDGTDTDSLSVTIDPPSGYAYVTLEPGFKTDNTGFLYNYSGVAEVGDQFLYPTADITLYPDGNWTTTGNVSTTLYGIDIVTGRMRSFAFSVGEAITATATNTLSSFTQASSGTVVTSGPVTGTTSNTLTPFSQVWAGNTTANTTLVPVNQSKKSVVVRNSDLSFSSFYSAGNKPTAPTFDKIISPSTLKADRFTGVTSGMRVGLQDGTYTSFDEGEIPDGVALEAINHGNVTISGGEIAWKAIVFLDGNNKELNGIRIGNPTNFEAHALRLVGNGHVIKNCALFNGGQYKHSLPLQVGGYGHLIEDCWAWGEGRYTVSAYQASHCTFRRVLARWDLTIGGEANEPNAAFVCYNSDNMIYENCISLDYGVPETAMTHGGDIFQANHLDVSAPNANNKFYGCFVVNHALNTNNRRAIYFDGVYAGGQVNPGCVMDDIYVRENGNSVSIASPFNTSVMKRITVINANAPQTGYEGTGAAQTEYRYQDGKLTTRPLWPWPNEARILADLSGPDNQRSTNPAHDTWANAGNAPTYCAYIASGKSLKDYILDL